MGGRTRSGLVTGPAYRGGVVLPIRDQNPTTRTPVITVVVLAACVLVYAVLQSPRSGLDQSEFLYRHAAIPCEVTRGEPLSAVQFLTDRCSTGPGTTATVRDALGRLQVLGGEPLVDGGKNVYLAVLVSLFLHGSWMHLLGNMLFLWIFANNIEDRIGSIGFALFYLATGVIAFGVHIAVDPSSLIPVVGASGAIAGAMGAYLVWYPRARVTAILPPLFFLPFDLPAYIVLGSWFVLQFFTSPDSGVAWVAHVGGFASGAVIAWIVGRWARPRTQPYPWVQD